MLTARRSRFLVIVGHLGVELVPLEKELMEVAKHLVNLQFKFSKGGRGTPRAKGKGIFIGLQPAAGGGSIIEEGHASRSH